MDNKMASKDFKVANLSFLCACFVIMLHVPRVTEPGLAGVVWWFMHDYICQCAVPFFFIVSGYFLAGHMTESGWWKRENIKRIRTLLVPYLIWCVLGFIFIALITLLYNVQKSKPICSNIALFDGQGLRIFGIDLRFLPVFSILWYVRSLILLSLVSPLLKKYIAMTRIWGLIILMIARGCLVPVLLNPIPGFDGIVGETIRGVMLGISLRGLLYFSVGIYLRCYPVKRSIALGVGGLLCGGAIYLARDFAFGGREGFLQLAVPFMLIAMFYFVPSKPLPDVLLRNSFPVYILHFFACKLPITYIFPTYIGTVWFSVLYSVFSGGGAIIFAELLRKCVPRFHSIAFGGRGRRSIRHENRKDITTRPISSTSTVEAREQGETSETE